MSDLEAFAVKVLQTIEDVRRGCYFPEAVMEPVMLSMDITEEEAIKALSYCIDQGWLSVKGRNPKFFLRPGYVAAFPVIISQKGLEFLKQFKVGGESF
ncbi:hypothetical protein Desca_1695 [Desulfotomaculum nigrificans CO-1-SRB]|uniref:Uncharacterized protein n=1 Tax=Desulfotomaculum nigrificans (strain DSM 14880 / VKM B-2319 / CO-1-SRB) TaxID=868595 RepID=F6B7I9_DESCC|nr:hypothetical protein [Desulfotomaculum nigrificans]AEF94543.1 hypothetical protein Desca_1695 [Desulfotomaculum nigrificans CO-1-SRB]